MKKTVKAVAALLFILSCVFCVKTASNVKAEETKYNIWVGEVQVTSANKDNIPGVVGGKATYNPTTHVLNFEGAVTGVQGKYKYNNYNEDDTLIFNDECDLTITGTFTPSEKNVENAIVCHNDHSLTIDGASTNIIVGSIGQTICTYGDFIIKAGSLRAVSEKSNSVLCYSNMIMDSGSFLAVNGVEADSNSVIYLYDDFYLNGGTIALNGGAYGISSQYGHFYINDGSLQSDKTLYAGCGIDISPDLTISQPLGGKLSDDGTSIHSIMGLPANNICIVRASTITYPLWVGNHQVTAANKDDIPVALGSASYNPATNTLTLKHVSGFDGTKEDAYGNLCLIYSELDNLTIAGDCNVDATGVYAGIYSKGNVELDGNIKIRINGYASNFGIKADGYLSVWGGHSIISSPDSGSAIWCGDFYLNNGYLEAYGDSKAVITDLGDISFNGGFFKGEAYNTSYGDAVCSKNDIFLNNDEKITSPYNAKIGTVGLNCYIVDTSDTPVKAVEVGETEEGYGVTVTGFAVTNKNRYDIDMTGLISGTVSYNPITNELNLDNVYASTTASGFDPVIESDKENLTVTGDAYLEYPYVKYGFWAIKDMAIAGDFDLVAMEYALYSVNGDFTLVSGDSSFAAADYTVGVAAQAKIINVIDGTYTFGGQAKSIETNEFKLEEGVKYLSPTYARYDSSKKTVVDGGGYYITNFTIGPEKYDLYIGGEQVTSTNCKSLPGVYNGSASYNPLTKTLYWSDHATLNYKGTTSFIEANDDLTINGRMYLNNKNVAYGIRCKKDLIVDGVIYVTAAWCGTDVKGDLKIGRTGFSYLESTASDSAYGSGVFCDGNVFIRYNSSLKGIGKVCGVDVIKSLEVNSSDGGCYGIGEEYGVRVDKDIKLNGALFASGNTEAVVYGGTIEIDPNYGIVKGDKFEPDDYDPVRSATHFSDDKKHFLTADNQIAKQVSVDDRFFIFVGNKKITYETRNDIKGLDTGKGSYDADTKTLTLEDALITEPWEDCIDGVDDMTIVTKGDVKIINKGTWGRGIYVPGKLTIDGPIYIKSEYGALGVDDLELKNGYEILIPEGGKFDPKKRAIVDKDGKIANIVEIGKKDNGATPTPLPTPDTTPEPGTASAGNTIEEVEAVILSLPNDDDPAGSDFATLQAKASKVTKNSIKLTWKKAAGAKSYYIYGNKCGTKNKYKKIKVVTKNSFTQKKLKKGTYYKYLVVAVDKDGKVLSTSKTIHAATTGGKVGNAKSLTTKAKKNKVSIKKGKSFKLKAKQKAASKKLKVKKHRAIQYESTNTEIATVSAKGVIKGVKKGTCYVYVYAQNGITKKIKVTVK